MDSEIGTVASSINLNQAVIYDAESGHFVSQEHQRIAEIIHDYDPDLYLCWIPPENRDLDNTQPFAIIHMPEGKPQYIVRKLKDSEVDARLLQWLFSNDQARAGNDILGSIEAAEAAKKALKLKEREERIGERLDLAETMLKSPLNWYRHGGKKYT